MGRLKTFDFGIARVMPVESSGSQTTPATELAVTKQGRVLGTVGYMSPEQVRGEHGEAQSDIFSLGCVMYEMLTRERLFRRNTDLESIAAILKDDPPPLAGYDTHVPAVFSNLIRHCLEKKAEDRPQSAAQLSADLRAIGSTRRLSRGVLLGVAVLAAVAVGLAIFTLYYLKQRPITPPIQSVAILPFRQLHAQRTRKAA